MPKGSLTNYAEELGQATCQNLLQWRLSYIFPKDSPDESLRGKNGFDLDGETGCWLWVGRTLPEGYAQIKRKTPRQASSGLGDRNAGKNFLMHRIAFVAKNGVDVEYGASHRCARARCFNPDHICDENIQLNNSRKGCVGVVLCPVHEEVLVNLCNHNPNCVKPNPEGIRCCLTRVEESSTFPSAPTMGGAEFSSDPAQPKPVHQSSPELPPVPESSPPIRDGRRRQRLLADLERVQAIDPTSLPGSENILSTESFIVPDDELESEI